MLDGIQAGRLGGRETAQAWRPGGLKARRLETERLLGAKAWRLEG